MTEDSKGKAAAPPVFLERQSYRRRRLMDAARLLPVLGLLLFTVPLLWPTVEVAGDDAVRMSDAVRYVFLCWGGLILAAAILGYYLRGWSPTEDGTSPENG